MESSPIDQLLPKPVTTNTPCNNATCKTFYNSQQETESILSNGDVTSNTLREHIQKLEHLCKKLLQQSEENKLNYCVALHELESYKQLTKIICYCKKDTEKCNKEVNVNLCSINEHLEINEKLASLCKVFNKMGSKEDPMILIEKGLSDIKIQFTLRQQAKRDCYCNNNKEVKESVVLSDDQDFPTFDIRESILAEMNENNENKQLHITNIDNQDDDDLMTVTSACRFANGKKTQDNKNNIVEAQLQIEYNQLLEENEKLKKELNEALEIIRNNKVDIEYLKKENTDLNTLASSLNRIEDIYQHTKLTNKLINELFWQLGQIQQTLQSLSKIQNKNSEQELIIKQMVSHLTEEPPKKISYTSQNGLYDSSGNQHSADMEETDIEEVPKRTSSVRQNDLYNRSNNRHSMDIKKEKNKCNSASNCHLFCECKRQIAENYEESTELDHQKNLEFNESPTEERYKSHTSSVQHHTDEIPLDAKPRPCLSSCSKYKHADTQNNFKNTLVDTKVCCCNKRIPDSKYNEYFEEPIIGKTYQVNSTTPTASHHSHVSNILANFKEKTLCNEICNDTLDKALAEIKSGYSAKYNQFANTKTCSTCCVEHLDNRDTEVKICSRKCSRYLHK